MSRKRQLIIDYQQKFGDEQGERILKDLERLCPLFRNGVDIARGADVNKILVLEGRGDVLKYIYRMMQRDPNAVPQTHALNITFMEES